MTRAASAAASPDLAPTGMARLGESAAMPEVETVTDEAGFLALRPEWDDLFARAGLPHQVFQSHVVLRHWLRHYGGDGTRLLVLTARRGGRLAMAWPLKVHSRFGVATARVMGSPVAQFADVLAEAGPGREALLAAGWTALRRSGVDLFEIRKLRGDAALLGLDLPDGARVTDRQQAPFADLARRVAQEEPGEAYSPRERSNYRRRLRRLAERGEVALAHVGPGPEAADLASAAIAMKRTLLRMQGIPAPALSDPRFAAVFRDIAADAAGGSPLRVSVIRCGDEPVGIDLSFDCKGMTFGHVIATHPDHQRGGVGSLLAHHSFAGAKARGSAVFDLLAPADPYKADHADGFTDVSDVLVPLTAKGRIAAALGTGRWRPHLKSALRTLPAPLRQRIAGWSDGAPRR